jgi:hypothetical protein
MNERVSSVMGSEDKRSVMIKSKQKSDLRSSIAMDNTINKESRNTNGSVSLKNSLER